ncbi:hypothetical protein C0J27_05405 [Candidatus Chromulinivorax destructor]|uniref:Uncharacterized protein n=2 Tax=Candidatus Chromulinivorax destructor TaxID=2066483 RepID=A0A345ZCX1_9BACT|nr:hypothetical protein C0J27_05405 [Candidatus Chromulinivorax destructor]
MLMKKILITVSLFLVASLSSALRAGRPTVPFPIPNSMTYPSNQESDSQIARELFPENSFSEITSGNKDAIDTFEQLKKSGIPFLRKESVTDPDSSGIQGYYWDLKNTDDKLQYGGIARAEQDRYVSVVAVQASRVSDEEITDVYNAQNNAKHAASGKFNPGYLIYFGTFIGEEDGKTYYLYGRYVNTLAPIDPLDANGNYPTENI